MNKLYPPKCANCNREIHGSPKVIGTPPELLLVHDFDCKTIQNDYLNK